MIAGFGWVIVAVRVVAAVVAMVSCVQCAAFGCGRSGEDRRLAGAVPNKKASKGSTRKIDAAAIYEIA